MTSKPSLTLASKDSFKISLHTLPSPPSSSVRFQSSFIFATMFPYNEVFTLMSSLALSLSFVSFQFFAYTPASRLLSSTVLTLSSSSSSAIFLSSVSLHSFSTLAHHDSWPAQSPLFLPSPPSPYLPLASIISLTLTPQESLPAQSPGSFITRQ